MLGSVRAHGIRHYPDNGRVYFHVAHIREILPSAKMEHSECALFLYKYWSVRLSSVVTCQRCHHLNGIQLFTFILATCKMSCQGLHTS